MYIIHIHTLVNFIHSRINDIRYRLLDGIELIQLFSALGTCDESYHMLNWWELTSNLTSRTEAGVDNTPLNPSSGICHSFTYMDSWSHDHNKMDDTTLTVQSSDPVDIMLSWNGEKSKSVTNPCNKKL